MGLPSKDILQWDNQRIWSIIFLEVFSIVFIFSFPFNNLAAHSLGFYTQNIPQLGIQLWYLITFGADIVAVSSILFSLMSIVVTVLGIAARYSVLRRQQIVIVQFDVIGQDVLKGMTKTRGISRGFGPILMVDPRVIEFEHPLGIDDGQSEGLRLKMRLYVNHNPEQSVAFKELCSKAVNSGAFARICRKEWKLRSMPTVRNLTYELLQSNKQIENTVNVQVPVTVQMSSTPPSAAMENNRAGLQAVQSVSYEVEQPNNMMLNQNSYDIAVEPPPANPDEVEGDAGTIPVTFTEDFDEGVPSNNTPGIGTIVYAPDAS